MAEAIAVQRAPAVAADLAWYPLFESRTKGTTWALGSVSRDSFLSVPDRHRGVVEGALELMDGQRSVPDIEDSLRADAGNVDVGALVHRLDRANLLAVDDPARRPVSEYETMALRLFSARVAPNSAVLRVLAFLAVPAFVVSVVVFVYACVQSGLVQQALAARLFQFTAWDVSQWGIIGAVSVAAVALHELAHAVAARACGLRASRVTASLYLYLSPIVYVTIPGLYTVSRARRLLIWAAGPWMNLALAASCAVVAPYLSGPAAAAAEVGITVNLLLCAVNLYPFLPLDGYFIAATLTKVTNLRSRALSLSSLRSPGGLSLPARVVLYVYAAITWGTMAFIVGREIVALFATAYGTFTATTSLVATADAVKTYLLVLIAITYGLIARRVQSRRKDNHVRTAH